MPSWLWYFDTGTCDLQFKDIGTFFTTPEVRTPELVLLLVTKSCGEDVLNRYWMSGSALSLSYVLSRVSFMTDTLSGRLV